MTFLCKLFSILTFFLAVSFSATSQELSEKVRPMHLAETIEPNTLSEVLDMFETNISLSDLKDTVSQGKKVLVSGRGGQTARKWFFSDQSSSLWVLKESPWYAKDPKKVKAITEAVRELLEKGVPLPKLVRSKTGSFFAHSKDKDLYILQPFLSGQQSTRDLTSGKLVGEFIAQFHLAGEQYARHSTLPRREAVNSALEFLDTFNLEIRQKTFTLSSHDEQSFINYFVNEARMILNNLNNFDQQSFFTILHGDLNPTNILVSSDNRVTGLVDFDDFHLGNSVDDLARALLQFSFFNFRPESNRFEKLPSEMDHQIAGCILYNYLKKIGNKCDFSFQKRLEVALVATGVELFTLGFLNGSFRLIDLSRFRNFVEILKLDSAKLVERRSGCEVH